MVYIKESAVRKTVNKSGRRVGRDFLVMLDAHVGGIIERAVRQHDGGKKTLDRYLAAIIISGNNLTTGKK